MKKFARAAVTTFYNAQKTTLVKPGSSLRFKKHAEEVLHQLLKDLHPNLECRQLLAETDKIILNHISYQTLREFKTHCKKYLEPGEYDDRKWMPEEYAYVLKDSIKPLRLANDYADSTGHANGNGLNDIFDFNASSPNAFSPLSNSSGTIEDRDGDAIRDLYPILGYYTSQDSYILSLPLNDVAIEPNPNTTINLHDTELSMGTPTPLPNTRTMDQDAEAMDNFISPSSWNDTHWDAFVDTEISTPTEDIDMILRNATSVNAQNTAQVRNTTQLSHTPLKWNREWDAFVNTAANETTNSSAPSQHAVQTPNITQLNKTFSNSEHEWDFVDFDSLTRSNAAPNGNANVSAVPMQYNLLRSNVIANANAIGHYYSVGQGISRLPNDFGYPADYSRAGRSFDREGNAACDLNGWTTVDWTTIDLYPPYPHSPHAAYPYYTVDWISPNLNTSHTTYQPLTATF